MVLFLWFKFDAATADQSQQPAVAGSSASKTPGQAASGATVQSSDIYARDPITGVHSGTVPVPSDGTRTEYFRFPAEHPLRARILKNLLGDSENLAEIVDVFETLRSPDDDPLWDFVIIAHVKQGDGVAYAKELRKHWEVYDHITWNRERIKHSFLSRSQGTRDAESKLIDFKPPNHPRLAGLMKNPPPTLQQNPELRCLSRGRFEVSGLFYAPGESTVVIVHTRPAWYGDE